MERITLNSALARFCGAKVTGDQRSDLIARGKVLVAECAGRAHNDALVKAGRPVVELGSTIGNATAFAAAKSEWADDVLYFCAAEMVNRLVVITYNTDIGVFSGKQFQKLELSYVRILVLIYHDYLKTRVYVSADCRIILHQQNRFHYQIAEIYIACFPKAFFVCRIIIWEFRS